MTGEKKKILVIGKSQSPRCFKNVKRLPVDYDSNKSAWMTSSIFASWLLKWDKDLRQRKRKILLLLDNCSAHNLENVELSNIEVQFMPPNTTSVLQPMDQVKIN